MSTKKLNFKDLMKLQARFLLFKAYQLHLSEVEVASKYAPRLRAKLEQKYLLTN